MTNPSAPPKPPTKSTHVRDLLLLFSVPIAISLLAAGFTYIPRLTAHPTYSFLYGYCDNYDCEGAYSLNPSGKVIRAETTNDNSAYLQDYKLGLYDASNDSTRIVSYAEAQDFDLINSSKSPDGYTLVHQTSDGGFLFWGNYDSSWQLENGMQKKLVRLNGSQDAYSSNNVTFLGWVKK